MLICKVQIEQTRRPDDLIAKELARHVVLMIRSRTNWVQNFVDLLSYSSRNFDEANRLIEDTLEALRESNSCSTSLELFNKLSEQLNIFRVGNQRNLSWPQFLGSISEIVFSELMVHKYSHEQNTDFFREAYPTIARKAIPDSVVVCGKPLDVVYWNYDRGSGEFLEVKKNLKTLQGSRMKQKFTELVSFQNTLNAMFQGHEVQTSVGTLAALSNPHIYINALLDQDSDTELPLKVIAFEQLETWLRAA